MTEQRNAAPAPPAVELACRDCGNRSVLHGVDAEALRTSVAAFFSDHPTCRTTIDLSQSRGLTFPARAGA